MKYIEPKAELKSFTCPFCNVIAGMYWQMLIRGNQHTKYWTADCHHCKESSIWIIDECDPGSFGYGEPKSGIMVYPIASLAPQPESDMPDDVKIDYYEAAEIYSKSPRGAAALLRLALQKLCKHLGEKGENINDDIRSLAAKNSVPAQVVMVADTLRIVGNNAVHPGEMSDKDFDKIASKLFDLLNFIVKKAITEPAELTALYNMVPSGPRNSAEKTDLKNKNALLNKSSHSQP